MMVKVSVSMALVMRLDRALLHDDVRSLSMLVGRSCTVFVEWSMWKSDVHGMDWTVADVIRP